MIEYTVALPPYEERFIGELHSLAERVFGGCKRDRLEWTLTKMPDPSVHIARAPQLVGFKFGYATAPRRYYSWLGGVDEGYRRQGIALQLLENQHDWARG